MSQNKHLVFVYGTLKSGEYNHQILNDPTTGFHKFIANGQTIEKFPLIIASKYNIPFLLNDPGNGHKIVGEIYSVDDQKLVAMDKLEAHPNWYRREKHPVQLDNGETLTVWIYLLPSWKDDFLRSASEPMPCYNSKGSHGRELVTTIFGEAEVAELMAFVKGQGS